MIKNNQITIYIVTLLLLSSLIAAGANAAGNSGISILTVFTPTLLALVMVLLVEGKTGAKNLFVDQLAGAVIYYQNCRKHIQHWWPV